MRVSTTDTAPPDGDALTDAERDLWSLVMDDPPTDVQRPTPGQDNSIAVVDSTWVIRIPRTDEARRCSANEIAVLAAMPSGPRVPRPVVARADGMVYPYIQGTAFNRDEWRALTVDGRRRSAADIRTVLQALHAISPTCLPDTLDTLDACWVIDSITACAADSPRRRLSFDVATLRARFERAWSGGVPLPTIVHVDLKPTNLLLDGERTAVIDFGGLSLGDPAIDYGVLAHHLGCEVLEALGVDGTALAARARCYADLYELRRCTRGWTRSVSRTS